MTTRLQRREFVKISTLAGAGYWLGASPARAANSANEKLNIAVIGVGGRGGQNLSGVSGENIVALCDVDDQRAGGAFQRFPNAKKFYDYRKMFDAMEGDIDAVVVSTPDHTHFHPALAALQRDKHLYLEKPMAHNVWECRVLTDLARKKKLATQLGVQRHTLNSVRQAVELIRAGAIGTVTDCHSWIDSRRGLPATPQEFPPVPDHLQWDLWMGPTAERKYSPAYCPYNWRFWWDYGTGETGNWGCHILDIPFWALGLVYPTRVDASGPSVDEQRTPQELSSRLAFPALGDRPAVTLHWYQSKGGPPALKELGVSGRGFNTLFVGSDGMLLAGFGSVKLLPQEKFKDYKMPDSTLPKSPGFYREWTAACRGGDPATCQFDYSGPMAETVLLANVAYRAGGGFDWDAATLTASNNPQAQALIREPYRKGWEVDVA